MHKFLCFIISLLYASTSRTVFFLSFSLPLFLPLFIVILFVPLVYKYLCSEIGCRDNFVTYLCTFCINCPCNKSTKKYASTCFEHHVLITRRSKLYYTASGVITPVGGRPVHQSSLNLCTGRPPTGVMMIPDAV